MVTAIAVSLAISAALIDAANTYDTNAITNLSIQAWDRFDSSHMVWVEVVMTYPGGEPLYIDGDISLCLLGCPTPKLECTDHAKHGCWTKKQAGSALQVRYEGVVDVGFDASRGDALGYVVYGPLHSTSGTVSVQ